MVSAHKKAQKELRNAIKSSELRCWKKLCRTVNDDPWGLTYRIITKNLEGRRQIRIKAIVEALFPTHKKRSEITRPIRKEAITLFSIQELQVAAK